VAEAEDKTPDFEEADASEEELADAGATQQPDFSEVEDLAPLGEEEAAGESKGEEEGAEAEAEGEEEDAESGAEEQEDEVDAGARAETEEDAADEPEFEETEQPEPIFEGEENESEDDEEEEEEGEEEDEEEDEEDEEESQSEIALILETLASSNPYTVLLGIALLAILISFIAMWLEWADYDYDTKAESASRSAAVASNDLLDEAWRRPII